MKYWFSLLVAGLVMNGVNVPFPSWAEELSSPERYAALTNASKNTKDSDEQAIRAQLERYRMGYQQTDPETLAEVFTDFSPALRAALVKYRESVKDLTVKLDSIDIHQLDTHEAIATFTRQDSFIDTWTGRPVQMNVEQTKKFIQQGGRWKMRAAAEEY